jgi:hypothetical protein
MSSTSSIDRAGFSGLGVGWVACDRETLLKKEVMGLCIGFGLAGALAGDFVVVDTALDGFGDAARVCERVGFFSPRDPFGVFVSVPLLGRSGGGVCESSPSEPDESTIGFFRTARSLAIPPRVDRSEEHSTAR